MSHDAPKRHPLDDLRLPPPRPEVVARLNEQYRRMTEAIKRGESDVVAEGENGRPSAPEREAMDIEDGEDVARRLTPTPVPGQ